MNTSFNQQNMRLRAVHTAIYSPYQDLDCLEMQSQSDIDSAKGGQQIPMRIWWFDGAEIEIVLEGLTPILPHPFEDLPELQGLR